MEPFEDDIDDINCLRKIKNCESRKINSKAFLPVKIQHVMFINIEPHV